MPVRGSRKHVLDWVETSGFFESLNNLVKPAGATVRLSDEWRPKGHADAAEARLDTFRPPQLSGFLQWDTLRSWWLRHHSGANTPNWDLVSTCTVDGRRGLVLLEAKANVPELSPAGKFKNPKASERSRENLAQITDALKQASDGLRPHAPNCHLTPDSHYQLANRIAFAWKLASLGVPTVLVYLGFLNDEDISDVGEPITSEAQWRKLFRDYAVGVGAAELIDRAIDCGPAPMHLLVASRPVDRAAP